VNRAIIAAAGRGSRFGRPGGKQFADLLGVPLIAYAIEAVEKSSSVGEIVIVAGDDDIVICREFIANSSFKKVVKVVTGGKRRQDSVYIGLREMPADTEKVIIHDGARPLITVAAIEKAISASGDHGGILAVPVTDTIKFCDDYGFVLSTRERAGLWAAQTPQVFPFRALLRAYSQALESGIEATDDAAVFEASGGIVKVITGDYENIKVTTEIDLKLAGVILSERIVTR